MALSYTLSPILTPDVRHLHNQEARCTLLPLRGICEYDKELVETRYKSMGKQAIVIY